MLSIPLPLTSDSTSLAIAKLCDDGSNWSDYKPCLCRVMGAKGLWLLVEGKATVPKAYVELNGIPVSSSDVDTLNLDYKRTNNIYIYLATMRIMVVGFAFLHLRPKFQYAL